jgi:hydroxymethylpyrimidine pyrophosphatase-like HAD family hydrolase
MHAGGVGLGIVVSDLDGTLLDAQHRLSSADRRSLVELGERGILRAVATGRSLFSALRVLDDDWPIDFLVHASGAGVSHWPSRELVKVEHMPAPLALELARRLQARGLDFMLHRAVPENHCCYWHKSARANRDFERRVELYAGYMQPFPSPIEISEPMCQAIVIDPAPSPGSYPELVRELSEFSVIRTTSPLDGSATWIEVFPRGVRKSAAARWLLETRAAASTRSLAVGNDYNDVDLLDWADLACVVGNAPAELCARYRNVASNEASGFSEAVRWALAECRMS